MGLTVFGQNKFYYIKSGNCKISIKGKEYEGIPNRWFFIPAEVPHSYSNDESKPFSKHWLHFDLYPDGMKIFETAEIPFYVDVPKGSRVDKMFKEIWSATSTDKAADIFRAKASLMWLIGEYINMAAPQMRIDESHESDLQRILDYTTENMEKNITVEELAALWHLHPNHFIRVFKKNTGETPGRFIQLQKMEYSKRLIEETDLPISEIMNRVGICDAAQFSKKFHSLYGNSPRAYRQIVRRMKTSNKKNTRKL